tara:strand:+ start:300 stop:473 length:174 start_codon:yes stop_codon:yes gene_type:complete
MKVKITYANDSETRFKEVNTLEELIYLTKEEKEDIIIQKEKPIDADLEVIVYNDYLE